MRSGVSDGRAFAILLTLMALLPPFMMIRPLLFTIPGFAITLIVLERAERGQVPRVVGFGSALRLWANLHGGFLAGLGMIGIWAAARMLTGWRRVLPGALALLGATLAACVNPYGWQLTDFPGSHRFGAAS